MRWKPGTHVQAFGKSLHAGQTGIVAADHGEYIMILADDPTYQHAARNSIAPKDSPNRYFFVDTLLLKELTQ